MIESANKNRFLSTLADWLLAQQDMITAENAQDIAAGRSNGLSDALIDRLTLTPARIEGMANDLRDVINLPDPVG
jgi:glutamate-5-semialdehyde dehydrogenase